MNIPTDFMSLTLPAHLTKGNFLWMLGVYSIGAAILSLIILAHVVSGANMHVIHMIDKNWR